jgi:hypothetical protein
MDHDCKGHCTVNTNVNAKEQVALGRGRAPLKGVASGEQTGIRQEPESGEVWSHQRNMKGKAWPQLMAVPLICTSALFDGALFDGQRWIRHSKEVKG